jgi:hypothetical protein
LLDRRAAADLLFIFAGKSTLTSTTVLFETYRQQEMRMEIKEADNVQLNVGLLRACANERSLFCRGVAPGSARVFRCLAENMASADFGMACQISIMRKLRRREANWRLDPPLRQACKADVDRWVCAVWWGSSCAFGCEACEGRDCIYMYACMFVTGVIGAC